MKNQKLILFCILIILIVIPISLSTTPYEKGSKEETTVSRIVGSSPQALEKQLEKKELNIEHATLMSQFRIINKPFDVLSEQEFAFYQSGIWNKDELQNTIEDADKNELIIVEGKADIDDELYLRTPVLDKIEPSDIKNWNPTLKEKDPLIILDSPNAGLSLPKTVNFNSELEGESNLIAPNYVSSYQFISSFLCSLETENELGEIYRNSRNFHFNGGSTPKYSNQLGSVLDSYSLYANPLTTLKVNDWNPEEIKDICKNYLENSAPYIEYLETVGNYSKYRKHVVFDIPSYSIEQVGNYSIIEASPAFNNYEYGELVLPMAVRTTHFPKNSIITDYHIDFVGDYEDITVQDIPTYEDELIDRICYQEQKNYSIELSDAYTEDSHDLIATIYPIEIINCTEGRFRLYKTFNYSVDYVAISPVLIKEIEHRNTVGIDENIEINISLDNVWTEPVNGQLEIRLENSTIATQPISTSNNNFTLNITSPSAIGKHDYVLSFIYNNETVTSKKFSIKTETIGKRIINNKYENGIAAVSLELNNRLQEPISVNILDYLIKDDSQIYSGSRETTLNPGINTIDYTYETLSREDQSYEAIYQIFHDENKDTITDIITTNNRPVLSHIDDITSYESDLVNVSISAYDPDNDQLEITLSDPIGNDGLWQTGYDDEGNYTITITATDGLLTKQDSFNLIIRNKVPPAIFYGKIIYDNGSIVEDTILEAYINDTYMAYSFVEDGNYNITIESDDEYTSWKDGAEEGDIIEVYVDGYQVENGLIWHPDTIREEDLIITASVTVDITNCSNLDKDGTRYILKNDIIVQDISYCINISANNIVLDCQGYRIKGNDNGAYGISIVRGEKQNTNNIIRNCTISSWGIGGIYLKNADNNLLADISLSSNEDTGFYLYYSDYNTLRNIDSSYNTEENSYGAYMYRSHNNSISDSTIEQINGTGISLYYSDSNVMDNLDINSNIRGISLYLSDENLLEDSSIMNNEDYGLRIRTAGRNEIRDNVISNNGRGAYMVGSVYNSFNRIYNNLFNQTTNVDFDDGFDYINFWNTSRQYGLRIDQEQGDIGGNFWANNEGSGYSQTCTDEDYNGFCDESYLLAQNNIDHLPLSVVVDCIDEDNDSFYTNCGEIDCNDNSSSTYPGAPEICNGIDDNCDSVIDSSICKVSGPCYASTVENFSQGTRKDGSSVYSSKSNPIKALGVPENNVSYNFVSLGFAGELELGYDMMIVNMPGNDIMVYETNFDEVPCAAYPETAKLYASVDGINWEDIGSACQDGEFDLGRLPFAKYLKVVDESDPARFGSDAADGYDLDGIEAFYCYDESRREIRANLSLAAGWNLISIPLIQENESIIAVLSSIEGSYDMVYTYQHGNWISYSPDIPIFLNSLRNMSNLYGYWIKMNKQDRLEVKGFNQSNITISIDKGINLIGYPYMENLNISDAMQEIIGEAEYIYGYDPYDQGNEWKNFNPDLPMFLNSLTELEPGHGYWVKVKNNTNLIIP